MKVQGIQGRRSASETRLTEVRSAIKVIDCISDFQDLCIYVTGSYGRLEASSYSDIDLFFVHSGSEQRDKVSKIDKILLDANLIKLCRDLGFPELSNDAEYLEIHYMDDIVTNIGSRIEDEKNYFTARMLLLMESTPLHNEAIYSQMINKIIDAYFKDYHDHESDFRPVFLANDIIRFWKTLCLNYEHRRERRHKDADGKNKSHLTNLKLKFSRMLTCYSLLLCVIDRNQNGQKELSNIVQCTPVERIYRIKNTHSELSADVERIISEYEWFLAVTDKPSGDMMKWIGKKDNRDDAFNRAREFGKSVYHLLEEISKGSDTLRYLVI